MPTANEIIQSAMQSRENYDRMAAQEMKVWGAVLPDREADPVMERDMQAAAELGFNRGGSTLPAYADKNSLTFESCLSLGCGEGRAERNLIRTGVCSRIHGIDISADAIESGRQRAAELGLPITYQCQDINFIELPEGEFDLVVAQTFLHHLVFLEQVFFQIWQSLKPGGLFWVHEYVGETQFQYLDERLEIVNRLLSILPAKYRTNRKNGRILEKMNRRAPGTLISPFESIRSGDIKPLLMQWFEVEWSAETDAVKHLMLGPGVRESYVESEDSRAIFELIMMVDELCIKKNILPPAGGIYALRPKPRAEVEHLIASMKPPFSDPI